MAILNGHSDNQERSLSPSQHLGKRKRTASLDPDDNVSAATDNAKILRNALEVMRRYDPTAIILRFPLPARDNDSRTLKKQKMGTTDRETDNIEYRILNSGYQSMEDLMEDVSAVKKILFRDGNSINGTTPLHSSAKEQISLIWQSLSNLQAMPNDTQAPTSPTLNGTLEEEQNAPALPSSQVLSLRSQTEHGIRQLFSGLPNSTDSSNVTGKDLPNGFELSDVLTMDKTGSQGKDIRKFGDVFAAHRNVKTLEMPRLSRPVRGNRLDFIPPLESIPTSTRNDFKFANLSTSLWLKYAIPTKPNPDSKDRYRPDNTKASTLFKSAFTTFAPTMDGSHASIPDRDRSQQWWHRHGRNKVQNNIFSQPSLLPVTTASESAHTPSDQELEEMVTNFVPDENTDSVEEEILEQVSELIETLVSHQAIRNLEVARGPSSASKPSKDEQSTYEMLRDQLQLLISSLPPFAVAKLNGNQLDELNISTQMLVSPPEFVGTAQVDDYTLRRHRAAQAATTASARNPAPVPARPTYGTPASAYSAQARVYNNVAASAYPGRPTMPMYNTPRAANTNQTGSYTQPQYRTGAPAIHTPSIQQFQRPITNGYGSTATPTPQASYGQRPAQPIYQQRPQDNTPYSRPDSIQKSISNGDVNYQQRSYVPNNNVQSAMPTTSGQQRMADDALKQMQSPATSQQPISITAGSGTVTS